MNDYPTLSKIEATILTLLRDHQNMYGLEILRASNGALARGSVYTILDRMIVKGFIKEQTVQKPVSDVVPAEQRLPRRQFTISGKGAAALAAHTVAVDAYWTAIRGLGVGMV